MKVRGMHVVGVGKKPSALGPGLQWECNLRRIAEGLKPYPGPRPDRVVLIDVPKPKRTVKVRRKR